MKKLPEPSIETIKNRVETNLLNDGLLQPYAILCTFSDKNVGLEIGDPSTNETSKKVQISRVLTALEQIEAYKVILIHESWRYEKPEGMSDTEFEEMIIDPERCEFLDRSEAYAITEITREKIRMFTKQYHRTEYNSIGFIGEEKITEGTDMRVMGYNYIQSKLASMN